MVPESVYYCIKCGNEAATGDRPKDRLCRSCREKSIGENPIGFRFLKKSEKAFIPSKK